MNDLLKLVDSLNKKEGFRDSLYRYDDIPAHKIIPTGSLSLDFALGIGGIPNNRLIEIAGPEHAGKTTLSISIAKNALEKFPEQYLLYLDCEGRLDSNWLNQLMPPHLRDRIVVMFPDNIQQATDFYEQALATGKVCVVILDSIGGAPSKDTMEKSATINNFGGNSKGVTRFAQSAGPLSNKYQVLTIGINQVRDKIGARYPTLDTPGGHAWKHACSARIWLKPDTATESKVFAKIKGQETQVGYVVNALIMKNSFGAPNKKAQYWFYNIPSDYGFGIDTVEETIKLSVMLEIVEQRGAWFYHDALPGGKAQGRNQLVSIIKDDEKVREQIIKETRAALTNSDDLSNIIDVFNPEEITDIFEEKLGMFQG